VIIGLIDAITPLQCGAYVDKNIGVQGTLDRNDIEAHRDAAE
jgi:hypothetical protein